jgi:hypothetical protein
LLNQILPPPPLWLALLPKLHQNRLLLPQLQWLLQIPRPHKVLPKQSWKPIQRLLQKLLLRWLKWLLKLLAL